MRRFVSVKSKVGSLVLLGIVVSALVAAARPAQGPARGGRGAGGAGAARASAAPAFLKVEWVRPPSQTGQVPVVQENIADPNVEMKWYGTAARHLLTSGTPGSDTTPFSVWSGECDAPFAITFRQKNNSVDLTGLGKIRWMTKTSGFHVVRPVVKLADGTMLIGNRADASIPMLAESEFGLADMRWVKLDPVRIVTLGGNSGPSNETWVASPDLSKVDEVGFADLMPGSGHGTGGYIHLGTMEVYGKPVPRAASTTSP